MLIFCATQPNEYFKSHGCVPVHHFHTEAMKLSLSDSEVKNWGGGRKSERGDAKTIHQVKNSGAGILKKVVCYCGWTSGFDPLSTNAIIICSSSCNTVHDGSNLATLESSAVTNSQKSHNSESCKQRGYNMREALIFRLSLTYIFWLLCYSCQSQTQKKICFKAFYIFFFSIEIIQQKLFFTSQGTL